MVIVVVVVNVCTCTFQCNFCRARVRDKNLKCDLTAISVRKNVGNLMQLGGDFWEIAIIIPLESHRNRIEIVAGLHLRQKLHYSAQQ